MPFEIRPVSSDELIAYAHAGEAAFGYRPTEQDIARNRSVFEADRSLAAFDGGQIVATAGAYSFDLTLPGGTSLPVPGVTWVGVLPSHRRRGILRAMMDRQLGDVRARGEALAILNASESTIYGHFGYGIASSALTWELDTRHAAFLRPPESTGRVRLIEHERALHEVFPALYDRVRRAQPGALSRTPAYWGALLDAPDTPVDGAGPRFYIAYESGESGDGQVDGIAQYRLKRQWEMGLPASVLQVRDLFAATPAAYTALWRFLLDHDLVQTVRALGRPVDEPLRWLLTDSRRLRMLAVNDDLWVRLLDIPAALGARRYATPGAVVFAVADALRPENAGRYALDGGPEGAECRLTTAEADLALDVADLGAAYLGGVSFGTLARAARVEERTPGALARADALFASDPAPWCGTPF